MKLNELNYSAKTKAKRALKETYNADFDVTRLSYGAAKSMFKQVCALLKESQQSADFYKQQGTSARMRLIFMKESLTQHLAELKSYRIITENEKVEEAQVTLAAQEMVDEIQKMIVKVSDMLVKELPAVADSTESDIGANESVQFTEQASEALTALAAALAQAKIGMQNARNIITGQGNVDFGAGEEEMEPGAMPSVEMSPDEMPEMPEMPAEEPEEQQLGSVGRERR